MVARKGAEKVSVSLSREDLRWARAVAKDRKWTLSAVITESLRRRRQAEARAKLLSHLGDGDIAPADVASVRAEWQK
jgi:hypothetical protein